MEDWHLDEGNYVSLLTKLIGEAKSLQNNPPDLVPVEDKAARHVLDILEPHSTDAGGPLVIQHVSFVDGRGNIIVEYPGEPGGGILSFVGCHLDVVTANPDTWTADPFTLSVDGDKLYGRGTTDCLGHVAMLTELFRTLAEKKPRLKRTVVGVYIANEENSKIHGIGVDELVKRHYLDHLKNGPLYWVDSADSRPCIGTGGIFAWQLTAYGKLFHSGIPQQSINPLELSMEAVAEMQRRFYADFPPHEREAAYGFKSPSTMKPTQWSYPGGSINQIPGECTVCGDVRVTPFYDIEQVMERVKGYAEDLNAHITSLPTRGPVSKYELPGEDLKGRVEFKIFDSFNPGVACNLESQGFHAMAAAFKSVYGVCEPFSMTGSLPCIRELQDEGYDVQVIGFGKMSTYHANNEYALLSDMAKGYRTLVAIIREVDALPHVAA